MEAWNQKTSDKLIQRHQKKPAGLLQALISLQETFGYIDKKALPLLTEVFNLSRADVWGVITFYQDFRTSPPGKHSLKICTSEACRARGGRDLVEQAETALEVRLGDTTKDGKVSLDPVHCLGFCSVGPALVFDGKPLARMTTGRLKQLLKGKDQ